MARAALGEASKRSAYDGGGAKVARRIAREMLIARATLLVQECGLPKHPTPDLIFF